MPIYEISVVRASPVVDVLVGSVVCCGGLGPCLLLVGSSNFEDWLRLDIGSADQVDVLKQLLKE